MSNYSAVPATSAMIDQLLSTGSITLNDAGREALLRAATQDVYARQEQVENITMEQRNNWMDNMNFHIQETLKSKEETQEIKDTMEDRDGLAALRDFHFLELHNTVAKVEKERSENEETTPSLLGHSIGEALYHSGNEQLFKTLEEHLGKVGAINQLKAFYNEIRSEIDEHYIPIVHPDIPEERILPVVSRASQKMIKRKEESSVRMPTPVKRILEQTDPEKSDKNVDSSEVSKRLKICHEVKQKSSTTTLPLGKFSPLKIAPFWSPEKSKEEQEVPDIACIKSFPASPAKYPAKSPQQDAPKKSNSTPPSSPILKFYSSMSQKPTSAKKTPNSNKKTKLGASTNPGSQQMDTETQVVEGAGKASLFSEATTSNTASTLSKKAKRKQKKAAKNQQKGKENCVDDKP